MTPTVWPLHENPGLRPLSFRYNQSGVVPSSVNYFNYFTEIEQHFQRKRGAQIFLSPVDWALIESWKDAGIPLEAVLTGIDQAFDKFETGRRSDHARPRALAYCAAAVLDAAEAMKEASVGGRGDSDAAEPSPDDGFNPERILAFLDQIEQQVRNAELPEAAFASRDEIAGELATMAARLRAEGLRQLPMEELDRYLSVLDDKLFAVLQQSTPAATLVGIKAELDRELASYRRRMRAEQLAMVERQFLHKRLLQQYRLPRLSLFYMS